LKVGREVAVEFTPPFTGLPIRVRGIVRNPAGYHYGMEFVRENAEETEGDPPPESAANPDQHGEGVTPRPMWRWSQPA